MCIDRRKDIQKFIQIVASLKVSSKITNIGVPLNIETRGQRTKDHNEVIALPLHHDTGHNRAQQTQQDNKLMDSGYTEKR